MRLRDRAIFGAFGNVLTLRQSQETWEISLPQGVWGHQGLFAEQFLHLM
jgi:hypothetical protein